MSDIVRDPYGNPLSRDKLITALRAEVEKLKTELDDRCPVDAMARGMTPVEAAIWHVWGERCSDFEPECLSCRAWAEYDAIIALRAENERLRAALGKMQRSRDRYRQAWEAEKARARAALEEK